MSTGSANIFVENAPRRDAVSPRGNAASADVIASSPSLVPDFANRRAPRRFKNFDLRKFCEKIFYKNILFRALYCRRPGAASPQKRAPPLILRRSAKSKTEIAKPLKSDAPAER